MSPIRPAPSVRADRPVVPDVRIASTAARGCGRPAKPPTRAPATAAVARALGVMLFAASTVATAQGPARPGAAVTTTPAAATATTTATTAAAAAATPSPRAAAPRPPAGGAPADPAPLVEIDLHVGESRVLPAPGVARIAVGNGQVLGASALDQREVLVFANAPGVSTLHVWDRQGRVQRLKITVTANDVARLAREVSAFLADVRGVRVTAIGDKVVVEGEQLADADLARIEQLAQRKPQVVNFTHRQGWEQMVMLDVKVVEFPVQELRELGLRWNASGGGAIGGVWSPYARLTAGPVSIAIPGDPPVAAAGMGGGGPLPLSPTVLSALNLGLGATLQAMAQSGRTTLLAEPQLSARNGAKASFLAGGEIPFTVSTVNGPTTQFKPYGVRLDILPRVDRAGHVRATIETEFSQVDTATRLQGGVPAFLVRRTSTEFNVRAGETIVLGGLVQRELATGVDKVPGLGDMPVLGALFRSKRFQNRETELVVFVTPTVVDPRTPVLADRVERTHERLAERLGAPPHLSDPVQPTARLRPAGAPEAGAPAVDPALRAWAQEAR